MINYWLIWCNIKHDRWVAEKDDIVYFPTVKMKKKLPILVAPISLSDSNSWLIIVIIVVVGIQQIMHQIEPTQPNKLYPQSHFFKIGSDQIRLKSNISYIFGPMHIIYTTKLLVLHVRMVWWCLLVSNHTNFSFIIGNHFGLFY